MSAKTVVSTVGGVVVGGILGSLVGTVAYLATDCVAPRPLPAIVYNVITIVGIVKGGIVGYELSNK